MSRTTRKKPARDKPAPRIARRVSDVLQDAGLPLGEWADVLHDGEADRLAYLLTARESFAIGDAILRRARHGH